ncbi:MAG: hypothetical protein Solumvirus1_41 [Solumvirus sp.]|uniref:Uncharacterized protein n=1 Tax=Solumvirus sp. TaxID=2487773 RepID=A0A3G5AG25_9VIRU|nr:MAG: hypothetical protein Solumvirus1_41 [Solumvirus sp.]
MSNTQPVSSINNHLTQQILLNQLSANVPQPPQLPQPQIITDIQLSPGSINFKNGQRIEDIVAQLQQYTNYVLCVENGEILKIYPQGTSHTGKFDYKISENEYTKVCYRDPNDEALCYFIPHKTFSPPSVSSKPINQPAPDIKHQTQDIVAPIPDVKVSLNNLPNNQPQTSQSKFKNVIIDASILKRLHNDEEESDDEMPKTIDISKPPNPQTVVTLHKN